MVDNLSQSDLKRFEIMLDMRSVKNEKELERRLQRRKKELGIGQWDTFKRIIRSRWERKFKPEDTQKTLPKKRVFYRDSLGRFARKPR